MAADRNDEVAPISMTETMAMAQATFAIVELLRTRKAIAGAA
jgi:hypothetical protein